MKVHSPGGMREPTTTRVVTVARRYLSFGLALLIVHVASKSNALAAVDFEKQIRPLLEQNCLSCHSGDEPEGGFDMTTHEAIVSSGASPPSIVPGNLDESPLYTCTVVERDSAELMPPLHSGGPLSKSQTDLLRAWIEEGALWPDGAVLKPAMKPLPVFDSPDNLELTKRIHALIVKRAEQEAEQVHSDYVETIPKTGVSYTMKSIPGGKFTMGSPSTEPQRGVEEGPQIEVSISPFWMGQHEVTWDEYEPFMVSAIERTKNGARKDYDPAIHTEVDAVSAPTRPYMEMSFGMGQSGYPAISMTQHAANKYCQWLSAQTGHFYRLPTEAEWEYACRAGTQTAYSFGDDPAMLSDYAWFYDNSNGKYQKVGTKKPNGWGLYDMHGNVMEWTIDQFSRDYFQHVGRNPADPLLRPQTLYPRSVRGGGWDDDPERLRSASRRGSDPSWKIQDPQLPKSIWYHTDARWLGFRIVRPRKIPSVEEMHDCWNSATGLIR